MSMIHYKMNLSIILLELYKHVSLKITVFQLKIEVVEICQR